MTNTNSEREIRRKEGEKNKGKEGIYERYGPPNISSKRDGYCIDIIERKEWYVDGRSLYNNDK